MGLVFHRFRSRFAKNALCAFPAFEKVRRGGNLRFSGFWRRFLPPFVAGFLVFSRFPAESWGSCEKRESEKNVFFRVATAGFREKRKIALSARPGNLGKKTPGFPARARPRFGPVFGPLFGPLFGPVFGPLDSPRWRPASGSSAAPQPRQPLRSRPQPSSAGSWADPFSTLVFDLGATFWLPSQILLPSATFS